MEKSAEGASAAGRTPPPAESQFRKGRSGNPAGRPKGSISLHRITRKVALQKHLVTIDGKPCRVTALELLILKLKAMAASGHPGAAAQINWLRSQTELSESDVAIGGFLIAPAPVTPVEFMAEEEARNAGKVEPGTEINIESEEFLKAVRGEVSPLGEALCAFYKKYNA
jgi:Family of unknown function (DUF5681)